MSRNARTLVGLGLVLVFSGLAAVAWMALPSLVSQLSYASEKGQAAAAREQLSLADDLSEAFQLVSKTLRPSVVTITSTTKVEVSPRPRQGTPRGFEDFFGQDDLLDRFFQLPPGERRSFNQEGLGTGFVVSADGYILTNNHVVRGADEIDVNLSDGRTLRAEIVGTDASTDLAVLKIDAKNLVPAKLGDSDALNVGQWVLAIGSPFGLDQTVTAGIVSAKNRSTVNLTEYNDFIQTDAAINMGNSGGPLVNLRGEVVGVNTAIATRTGGYMGVGFAIPSNIARGVMDSLIRDGKVQRGMIGAIVGDVTEDAAKFFKYDSREGALLEDVTPDGPAAKAGLKADDIVRSLNGKPIRGKDDLRNTVAATKPGSKAELVVFRNGKDIKFTVVIGEKTEEAVAQATGQTTTDELGITVQGLSPQMAQRLGYDQDAKGVVVTEVTPDGLAGSAGIRPGDLIVAINRSEVRSVSDYRSAVKESDVASGIRLVIVRDGFRRSVFISRAR